MEDRQKAEIERLQRKLEVTEHCMACTHKCNETLLYHVRCHAKNLFFACIASSAVTVVLMIGIQIIIKG